MLGSYGRLHADTIGSERACVCLCRQSDMLCERCGDRQKNRAFCYFCQALQRLPKCAQCGRQKCVGGAGDCLVKHPGRNVTGMNFVVRALLGRALTACSNDINSHASLCFCFHTTY